MVIQHYIRQSIEDNKTNNLFVVMLNVIFANFQIDNV